MDEGNGGGHGQETGRKAVGEKLLLLLLLLAAAVVVVVVIVVIVVVHIQGRIQVLRGLKLILFWGPYL